MRKLRLNHLPKITEVIHSRLPSNTAMIDSRELSYVVYHSTAVMMITTRSDFFLLLFEPQIYGQSDQNRSPLSNILDIMQEFEIQDLTNVWTEMHLMQSSQEGNLAICRKAFNSNSGFGLNNFISSSYGLFFFFFARDMGKKKIQRYFAIKDIKSLRIC